MLLGQTRLTSAPWLSFSNMPLIIEALHKFMTDEGKFYKPFNDRRDRASEFYRIPQKLADKTSFIYNYDKNDGIAVDATSEQRQFQSILQYDSEQNRSVWSYIQLVEVRTPPTALSSSSALCTSYLS